MLSKGDKNLRKISIVLCSIIIYISVCFIELFICNTSWIPLVASNGYTLVEKGFFVAVNLLSIVSVAYVLKNGNIKNLLINSIIMWFTFVVLGLLIDLRTWIGIITNNEAIVLGVNFLGDDIWISHYIGCFFGIIVNVSIIIYKHMKGKQKK